MSFGRVQTYLFVYGFVKMKVVPRLSVSTGTKKKGEVLARKLSFLDAIDKEKAILFAPFSATITPDDKVRGWQTVLHTAKAVGLVAQSRDWRFIRDKVFSVWKSRTMTKRENAIAADTKSSFVTFDKVDLKILDIIGLDSPVMDKLVEDEEVVETEDKTQNRVNQIVTHFDKGVIQRNTTNNSNQKLRSSVASSSAGVRSNIRQKKVSISNVEIDEDDYLSQKKKLTLELLKHDVYLRKLQALKLEKEMGLERSEYTRELLSELKVDEIKTENTSGMEFED